MNTLKNLLWLVLTLAFIYSCKEDRIGQVDITQNEIMLKYWKIVGPFIASDSNDIFDDDNLKLFGLSEENLTINDLNELKGLKKDSPHIIIKDYKLKNDFIDLAEILKQDVKANCYAFCVINSSVSQDVAMLFGYNNRMKVWLNNKLCYSENKSTILKKNDVIIPAQLNKCKNLLVLKINNIDDLWQFHFNISSKEYVRRYFLKKNQESFLSQYLLEKKENIHVTIDTFLYPIDENCKIVIRDVFDSIKLIHQIKKSNDTIATNGYEEGTYKIEFISDLDTITEYFVFGNSYDLYKLYESEFIELNPKLSDSINMMPVSWRYRRIHRWGIRQGSEISLERKKAYLLYDYHFLINKLKNGKEAFKHIPGLHLRVFNSKIDSIPEYYMVYIPKKYNPNIGTPLIVETPFITGRKTRFLASWHVANIDRIEYICNLSDQYGFAYLWTSSRIYNRYNLNPIAMSSSIETIENLKQSYNIDSTRTFLYGTCSGGLIAALLANRFPSSFAAVALEGPDLNYVLSEEDPKLNDYPSQWIKQNNSLSHLTNYSDIPMYILHSKRDSKSLYQISEYIAKRMDNVTLDNNFNRTKNISISLETENYNLEKIFSFFKNQKKLTPKNISFSTYQLKYNRCDWVTLNDIDYPKKASINAVAKDNTINISTDNVLKFTIDLKIAPKIFERSKSLNLYVNNNRVENFNITNDSLIIVSLYSNESDNEFKINKNEYVEGPINHFFSNSFIVVEDSHRSDSLANISELFVEDWVDNYFDPCIRKMDYKLTSNDIKNNNLLLINYYRTNSFLNRIIDSIPIKIYTEKLQIGNEIFKGNNLSYAIIYPNPLNNKKYILILGCNGNKINQNFYKDLSYKGWFDYEIYNEDQKLPIKKGYFNESWE